MKSYNTSLRRGVKWYRKLAIELVVGSALVNAFIIHQSITNDKMTITKFREHLIKSKDTMIKVKCKTRLTNFFFIRFGETAFTRHGPTVSKWACFGGLRQKTDVFRMLSRKCNSIGEEGRQK